MTGPGPDHTDWLTPAEIDAERARLRQVAEAEEIAEMKLRHEQRQAEAEAEHAAGNTPEGGREAGRRARLW